jgi:hypothetical protein
VCVINQSDHAYENILWKLVILQTTLVGERITNQSALKNHHYTYKKVHSTLIPLMCVMIYLSIVRVLHGEIIAYTVKYIPNLFTYKIFFCYEILNKCQLIHIWCVKVYVLGLEGSETLWHKHEHSFKNVAKVKAVRIGMKFVKVVQNVDMCINKFIQFSLFVTQKDILHFEF